MEIILIFIIIGVMVFYQLLRPKNFDQPVSRWSDDELVRRLLIRPFEVSIKPVRPVGGLWRNVKTSQGRSNSEL